MGRINRLTPTTTLTANSVIAMDAASGGATNKVTIQTLAAGLRSFGDYATQAQLAAKQDVLTFDDAPEEDSDNPVTSGGIYDAIGSAMSNVYTKAETDNAIAQSSASIPKIKHTTVTGTTGSNGALNLNMSANDKLVFSVVCVDSGAQIICLLVRATSGSQWIYAKKGTDMTAIANQSITVDVYYI